MIQLLIAILLGLACHTNTPPTQGNPGGAVYSTTNADGENGQIPPPPPPPKVP